VVMLMLMGPVLGEVALAFGPPEYVGMTFLGLTFVAYLGSGSMLRALMMQHLVYCSAALVLIQLQVRRDTCLEF